MKLKYKPTTEKYNNEMRNSNQTNTTNKPKQETNDPQNNNSLKTLGSTPRDHDSFGDFRHFKQN